MAEIKESHDEAQSANHTTQTVSETTNEALETIATPDVSSNISQDTTQASTAETQAMKRERSDEDLPEVNTIDIFVLVIYFFYFFFYFA